MQTATAILENNPQLIDSASSQISAKERESQARAAREPLMDRLWQRMAEIYGSGFVNQFGDLGGEGYETWLRGLSDLAPERIRFGIEKAVKSNSPYPPNLATFRSYCVDLESFGLPTPEAAYHEAASAPYPVTSHRWSHAAVYHAGADTGWSDLRANVARARQRFLENYAERCRQVMAGRTLGMPKHPALEKKPMPPVPKEFAKAQCEALKKLLG